MKKLLTLLITILILLTGCSKKTIKAEEAFSNYEEEGVITVFTDDEIDLSIYLKDTETYHYDYNFSLSDSEDEIELIEVTTEPISLSNFEEGEYTLTLRATLKDDVKTYVDLFKVYNITTIDNELNLTNLEKDTDLDALLEKYGLKYEGTVDTSKAGVYSVKITKGDKAIGYKSVVVAKDELEDGTVVENETKNEVNKMTEDTSKAETSKSNTLDTSDSRIALAYSWEGMSGTCESIAFNYLQAIGYLQNYSYESYLGNRYSNGFNKLSSPSAFMTLIEYDNGAHVAVYLGNDMALHGNYAGKAKVASMYLSDMTITAYYDMAITEKSSLVEEGGSNTNSGTGSGTGAGVNNSTTAIPEGAYYDDRAPKYIEGIGNYQYTTGSGYLLTDYYDGGYTTRTDKDSEEYKESQSEYEQYREDVEEMSKQEEYHQADRCKGIYYEWRAETRIEGHTEKEKEIEAIWDWCDAEGYEIDYPDYLLD